MNEIENQFLSVENKFMPGTHLHIVLADHLLKTKTASDTVLCDKAFNIAKNLKHNGYQCGLASIIYKFSAKLCQTNI